MDFQITVSDDWGFLLALGIALLACIFSAVLSAYRRKRVTKAIAKLTSGTQELTAEEFMQMRGVREGRSKISNKSDFPGVYIIHNLTKDMYYVGQSKNVLKRVSSHLSGSGNGDVYADLKHGDAFTIKAIPLSGSGYSDLDDLERDMIKKYNAFESGYNKTRGNGD